MRLLLLLLAALPLGLGDASLESRDFGPGPLFVNLHADETTSVQAALQVARRRGGRVLFMQNGKQRLVTFNQDDKKFVFDPNRIFTAAGVPATLHKYGPDTKAAEASVQAFAQKLLGALERPKDWPLIALHNNTPALSYSVQSYRPGGSDSGEAEQLFEARDRNPNDFFVVTEPRHFEALKARGFNVVLQKRKPKTDDGSLSVWAAQEGVPYVNVEAQHGHLAEQAEMLETLCDALGPRSPADAGLRP